MKMLPQPKKVNDSILIINSYSYQNNFTAKIFTLSGKNDYNIYKCSVYTRSHLL